MSKRQTSDGDPQHMTCVDLRVRYGQAVASLPYTFRILLENAHRAERSADVAAILSWPEDGPGQAQVEFRPRRLLMHDTTAVPALIDLAMMRQEVARSGGNPALVDTVVPVAVSIDHSIGVDHYGSPDAMLRNRAAEIARNAERYAFLKWADEAFDRLRVFAPGSGILHTLNIEHLATVADVHGSTLVPDTMLGTDSHTPMIGALGVLGWGIGGLEAEGIMLGHPMPLRLPEVVAVRLTGQLRDGVFATDLALHVTAELRDMGVVGAFVEFHGPGLERLSVGARAAIANMAPEYGATTGFFPIDAATLRYLTETGRTETQVARVEMLAKAIGIWHRHDWSPGCNRSLTIDMSALAPTAAGPRRPQDRQPIAALAQAPNVGAKVALAAITSCTNTADLEMLVTAALIAETGATKGLRVPDWVKTSFAPGSAAMINALDRAGLSAGLAASGFDVVGIGCTTCIGNSGPLSKDMARAIAEDPDMPRVGILSGNRNFPGRVHPEVLDSYLVSPPLVVAFAFAGRLVDVNRVPLGTDKAGQPAFLADIWPSPADVAAAMSLAADPDNTRCAYATAQGGQEWDALPAPVGPLYPFTPASTYLRPPPFAQGVAARRKNLALLAAYGDDVTTDHISPAGAIPAGQAADWLSAAGTAGRNVFAAYRGNYEVMARGAFTARTLVNLLCEDAPPGHTDLGDGVMPLFEVAGVPSVILAGERYGQGSSRDWAAKAPGLLGVQAILARSFERIHRSNLIGMGLAPVETPPEWAPHVLMPQPGDRILIDWPTRFSPSAAIDLTLLRKGEPVSRAKGWLACDTDAEADLLNAGGMIPHMLASLHKQCDALEGETV
ncbi:aconitate hydratase [Loktanella atrilutea]|uniref:Aconitate hydratase A n=1 Tax=Loktanella atrilutea TaxID=366533 RepID=A0A1M5FJ25_LOKAT|nr:aconitate hydratase AcnA [Loktanella atrilutea]SHF91419.1 aconitate hydratase [Loktanella atrilutea]